MTCELCGFDSVHEELGKTAADHEKSVFYDSDGFPRKVLDKRLTPEMTLCYLRQRWGDDFKLELGPGKRNKDGPPWGKKPWATIGLNPVADPNSDIYKDLDKDMHWIDAEDMFKFEHNHKIVIPLPDDCITEIWACQVLEHIRNIIPLMNDCYRVLVPGGFMHIEVPYYLAPVAVGDPTHVRTFSEESFKYYCRRPDGTQFVQRFSDYGITAMFVLELEEAFNGRSGLRVVLRKPEK